MTMDGGDPGKGPSSTIERRTFMSVKVTIDLDTYDLGTLADLWKQRVVTMGEIEQSAAFKGLDEYSQKVWVKRNQPGYDDN
jgi:hypothetical protein